MTEFPGKGKDLVQYDPQGLIVVPEFKSSGETPAAEQQERFTDVHLAIRDDIAEGRKYVIPSTNPNKPGTVYVMVPTGNVIKGKVELEGPDNSGGSDTWVKTIPVEIYLRMRENELEADRQAYEHVGKGVVDVAEAAVSAGAVEAPSVLEASPEPAKTTKELLGQLAEGLSAEDVRLLDSYASYTQDKVSAQKDGDGQGSIRSGQYAGQEYREMSPQAQSIANRYASLWIKLHPID
jgi:hypothetical protein